MYLQVIEICIAIFEMITRDHFVLDDDYTTREKPSSSAGFGPLSSAGAGATNKALQLTYSSSACCPTLLLYMNSCSVLWERVLLILSTALFAGTRYW